tara:strand:- start:9387 stop:10574 length:1188 start_codon:yes stop_codon:yes gene_type:complete
MLIEILLAIFLGILAGTITGLTPGIHTNLIGVFLISLSVTLLSGINPIHFVVFIVAMTICHSFLDFIPSVYLGCPDTDTELSVLPGHELLKKGQGYEAILLTAYGSLAAIFIIILIAYPSILAISKTYDFIKNFVPYLLIFVSIFLIFLESKKLTALFVFLLAGFLGWSVLNMELKEPLLPLLTGLFGSSTLLMSIKNNTQIPKQEITKPKTKFFLPIMGAVCASPLCSFLPGLGSGQAAIIGNTISRTDKKGFLVLIGATNTLVMGFSFISLYVISKTRSGATVVIKELIGNPTVEMLILILAVVLVSGLISFYLTIFLAKFFSLHMGKVNYTYLSLGTLSILIALVFLLSGFLGLAVLIASTFTGIYCIDLNVRRTNMMGCLLFPTIIFYLFV